MEPPRTIVRTLRRRVVVELLAFCWPFVGVEAAIAIFLYVGMRRSMLRLTWSSLE
jgi:hypothetical protein